jgi:hypothetical protein
MHDYSYKDPTLRMRWLIVFCVLYSISLLVSVSLMTEFRTLIGEAVLNGGADMEKLNSLQTKIQMDAAFQLFSLLGFLTFYSTWIYRIYANAACMAPQEMKYSAGWAAGSLFIPILNLWKPCQVLTEAKRVFELGLGELTSNWLVGIWWMVFILSIIGNQIDSMSWEVVDSAEMFANACALSIFCNLLDLTMLVLTIVVAVSVTGKCRRLYATVSEPQKA